MTLWIAFLMVGGLGVAAYLYRELAARFVVPAYTRVAEVQRPNDTAVRADGPRRPAELSGVCALDRNRLTAIVWDDGSQSIGPRPPLLVRRRRLGAPQLQAHLDWMFGVLAMV